MRGRPKSRHVRHGGVFSTARPPKRLYETVTPAGGMIGKIEPAIAEAVKVLGFTFGEPPPENAEGEDF